MAGLTPSYCLLTCKGPMQIPTKLSSQVRCRAKMVTEASPSKENNARWGCSLRLEKLESTLRSCVSVARNYSSPTCTNC
jgi:hypothetical protein